MLRLTAFLTGFFLLLCSALLTRARQSPPQDWIFFLSNRDGNVEVYRVEPDGDDLRPLTQTRGVTHCWMHVSTDSREVFFVRGTEYRYGDFPCNLHAYADLYTMRHDGALAQRSPIPRGYNVPRAWDERWLVFVDFADAAYTDGGGELYRLGIDGTTRQSITGLMDYLPAPALSPDGRRLSFVDDRDGDTEAELYTIHLEGGGLAPIGANLPVMHEINPVWSPDGQWVAFVARGALAWEIYRAPVTGEAAEFLGQIPATVAWGLGLAWSPDGDKLAYISLNDGTPGVYILDVQTRLSRRVGDAAYSSYVSLAWSPDSQWVVYPGLADRQINLFLARADGGERRQLTRGAGSDVRPVWVSGVSSAWRPLLIGGLGLMLCLAALWRNK